jgi:hypothetical protein
VQAQFWFVDEDQVGEFIRGLQEPSYQGHEAQRTVGKLMWAELVLRAQLLPIEQDALRVK